MEHKDIPFEFPDDVSWFFYEGRKSARKKVRSVSNVKQLAKLFINYHDNYARATQDHSDEVRNEEIKKQQGAGLGVNAPLQDSRNQTRCAINAYAALVLLANRLREQPGLHDIEKLFREEGFWTACRAHGLRTIAQRINADIRGELSIASAMMFTNRQWRELAKDMIRLPDREKTLWANLNNKPIIPMLWEKDLTQGFLGKRRFFRSYGFYRKFTRGNLDPAFIEKYLSALTSQEVRKQTLRELTPQGVLSGIFTAPGAAEDIEPPMGAKRTAALERLATELAKVSLAAQRPAA